MLSLLISAKLVAQPTDAGLQVGDNMPDIYLGQLLNDPSNKMKLSDFKGKLLIIDFWGTKCISCIAHMPKMDSLQREFGSRIQFVYVTTDSEKKVNETLAKVKVKRPQVPFFVNDSALNKFFPHLGDPLHVWITPTGVVYAITFDDNTNKETIQAFLTGKNPKLPRRWDWGLNQNYPIVSEQNGALLPLADSYSVWLKGLYNYDASNGIHLFKDSTGRVRGAQLKNFSVDQLYGFAYMCDLFPMPVNYLQLFRNNRLIFELDDMSVLRAPEDDAKADRWRMKNIYSYELKLPLGDDRTISDVLQRDLAFRLPGYEASIEYRRVKCIVLSDLSVNEKRNAIASDSTKAPGFIYNPDNTITVQNLPMDQFAANLIYFYSYLDTPFINESGFAGNLQMKLNAMPDSIEKFNRELNKYGFAIGIKEREIKMLVVRDKKKVAAH